MKYVTNKIDEKNENNLQNYFGCVRSIIYYS
jgi:hypothetical protein